MQQESKWKAVMNMRSFRTAQDLQDGEEMVSKADEKVSEADIGTRKSKVHN